MKRKITIIIALILLLTTTVYAIPVEYTAYGFGPSQLIEIGTGKENIQKKISAPEDSIITGAGLGFTNERVTNLGIWYKKIEHGGPGAETFKSLNTLNMGIAVMGKDSFSGLLPGTEESCKKLKKDKEKLANIIKNGNRQERTKIADFLLNNVKPINEEEENLKAIIDVFYDIKKRDECGIGSSESCFTNENELAIHIKTDDRTDEREEITEGIRNLDCQKKPPNIYRIDSPRYFLSRLSFMVCETLQFFYQEYDDKGMFKSESEEQETRGSGYPGFHKKCADSEKANRFPSGNVITGIGVGIEIDS